MDDNAMDDFFSIKDKKDFLDEEPDSRDFICASIFPADSFTLWVYESSLIKITMEACNKCLLQSQALPRTTAIDTWDTQPKVVISE